jgi:hypothetical protein
MVVILSGRVAALSALRQVLDAGFAVYKTGGEYVGVRDLESPLPAWLERARVAPPRENAPASRSAPAPEPSAEANAR